MSSALATPDSSMRIASTPMPSPRRLDANPGESRTTIGSFPMRTPSARAESTVWGAVRGPTTISTSLRMCAGLKKCMPTNRAGAFSPSAIVAIRSEEVLVARRAEAPAWSSTSAKVARFNARSSGTASITASAPATASARLVVARIREAAALLSSRESFPRATPPSSVSLIRASPPSAKRASTSRRRTSQPASAATCAIPRPIVPAPKTATRLISAAGTTVVMAGSSPRSARAARRDLEEVRHPRGRTREETSQEVEAGLVAADQTRADEIVGGCIPRIERGEGSDPDRGPGLARRGLDLDPALRRADTERPVVLGEELVAHGEDGLSLNVRRHAATAEGLGHVEDPRHVPHGARRLDRLRAAADEESQGLVGRPVPGELRAEPAEGPEVPQKRTERRRRVGNQVRARDPVTPGLRERVQLEGRVALD